MDPRTLHPQWRYLPKSVQRQLARSMPGFRQEPEEPLAFSSKQAAAHAGVGRARKDELRVVRNGSRLYIMWAQPLGRAVERKYFMMQGGRWEVASACAAPSEPRYRRSDYEETPVSDILSPRPQESEPSGP